MSGHVYQCAVCNWIVFLLPANVSSIALVALESKKY